MPGTYVFHRPAVNSYLVRERDRRRWSELLWVLVFVLPLGLALLADIWVNHELVRTGYRITELESTLLALERQERLLEVKLLTLSSPLSIDQRARAELGMIEPGVEQTTRLEGGR